MSAADLPVELQDWLQPLLARLQPNQVRRLARMLSVELRAQQSKRIATQRNPDGTPFEPRRTRERHHPLRQSGAGWHRSERDRVAAMFSKLRTSAHLKARSSTTEAGVQIEGRSARIARVHQFGLLDRPQPGGPEVRYPARVLLGWSDADVSRATEQVLHHLAE